MAPFYRATSQPGMKSRNRIAALIDASNTKVVSLITEP